MTIFFKNRRVFFVLLLHKIYSFFESIFYVKMLLIFRYLLVNFWLKN